MKRMLSVALALRILLLAGCTGGGKQESSWTKDPNGVKILVDSGRQTAFPDALPYDIPYNETSVTVTEASVFQNCVNYSYCLFVVAKLDVSHLNDQQIHWLRESDLTVRCFVTHEKNEYDFSPMDALGNVLFTDEHELLFVFMTSFVNENRYDFAGADITLSVDINQEKEYTENLPSGKTLTLNYQNCLHYKIPTDSPIPDAEEISEPLYDYVVKWLKQKVNVLP